MSCLDLEGAVDRHYSRQSGAGTSEDPV